MVSWILLAGLLVEPLSSDADQFPLALHRAMEIDQLDREIQTLHDSVLLKQAQIVSTQRLAQRGLVSRTDLERELAALRHDEAQEAECKAYRKLKHYERDVMANIIEPDRVQASTLLLDWIKKQKATAEVDVHYREFLLKQARALFQRKVIGRSEFDEAEQRANAATATLALSNAREAQVSMELASHQDAKNYDRAQYQQLKTSYLKARVSYYEIVAQGAKSRLASAQQRSLRGVLSTDQISLFEKAVEDAQAALKLETSKYKSALEQADPPTDPRPSAKM